jgi:hypothetical protein
MLKFKGFLTEVYHPRPSMEEIHAQVQHHLAQGEIVNPEYKTLKDHINRHLGTERDEFAKKHYWGKGGNAHPQLGELGHTYPPDYIHQMPSLGKTLKKFSQHKDHPLHQDLQAFHDKHIGLHHDMEKLKGMVVKTSVKREQKKAAVVVATQKRFHDNSTLTKVLTQHHDEYVNEAKKRAGEHHDIMNKHIKAAGGLDAYAPHPDYKHPVNYDEIRMAKQHRAQAEHFVKTPRAEHVKVHGEGAHASYMGWVDKLTQKIGKPVTHATMEGNPWHHSNIHVTTHDGEKQHWHTKMILNRSKYDNAFNQFPTRRVDKPDKL